MIRPSALTAPWLATLLIVFNAVAGAAQLARLKFDAGLVVIVAMISPHRGARAHARSLFPRGAFIEVFVDTPIEVCEQRDPKGLYTKARRGELQNFTGINSSDSPTPEQCRWFYLDDVAKHCATAP